MLRENWLAPPPQILEAPKVLALSPLKWDDRVNFNMGSKQAAKILALEQEISDLQSKTQQMTGDADFAQKSHNQKVESLELSWKAKLDIANQEHGLKIEALEKQVSGFAEDVKEKQAQIDRKELKKLASAYKEQEDIYVLDVGKWFRALTFVACILVASTIISIYISLDEVWYNKFEYYVIDLIFISAVWFCGSQYADSVKLKNDYSNRKTIAQSFHNILNNLPEDELIRDKFIEKATDVLCAPSPSFGKEPVLSKKIVKETAEIVKAVTGN